MSATSKVYVSDLFKESADWYRFYSEFHDYIVFGDQPDIFGRDKPLDLVDMHHIHLAATLHIQQLWKRIREPFNRTTPENEPENDIWLIYAHDAYVDTYLLLTILDPDAHNRERWSGFLSYIRNEIVLPWTQGRLNYGEPIEPE